MLVIFLIIFVKHLSIIQLILFFWLSITNLAYLVGVRPFVNKQDNYHEILNEAVVYLTLDLMFCLLNAANSEQFRSQAGWAMIGLNILGMSINILLVGLDIQTILYSTYKNFKKRAESD